MCGDSHVNEKCHVGRWQERYTPATHLIKDSLGGVKFALAWSPLD